MILTALLTGIITATLILGGLILFFMSQKRKVQAVIKAFVTQPDEKTPSPLAKMVDDSAALLSAHLVMQVKTTLMGLASVDSKNAVKAGTEAILEANPALGMLLHFIPGAKRLVKNPAMLSLFSGALTKMSGKNGSNPPASGNVQTIFKL